MGNLISYQGDEMTSRFFDKTGLDRTKTRVRMGSGSRPSEEEGSEEPHLSMVKDRVCHCSVMSQPMTGHKTQEI